MKRTLPQEAKTVMKTLRDAGFQAYVVGGSVRDMIQGRETKDWDFTTDAPPEKILSLFSDSFYNNAFGTVGVPIKKKLEVGSEKLEVVYEITTFRSESAYSDYRHPDEVVWGETLEEDLKRRDFTINAMAYDGEKITDPYNGQDDLKKKLVRAVGDPNQRFSEDALRMMRAIRIATELQFVIDADTFSAIVKNVQLITKISHERTRDELLKILVSDYPADGIKMLRNAGLLQIILPELERCFGIEQKSPKRHHIYDVGTHLLLSLQHCPSKNPVTRFATLIHDIGKAVTVNKTPEGIVTFYNHEIVGGSLARSMARRLRFSKKDAEKLFRLVRYHQFTVDERQTDSAIRRFIRNVTPEYLDDMLSLRTGDRLGGGARETSWRLELFKKRLEEVQKQPFTAADLTVDGHDIMKIYNIHPGPLVGAVLNMLFNDVVEGKLPNERETLLKRIQDLKKESKIN